MSENKGEQVIAQGLRTQATLIKILSWFLIVAGVPLSFLIIGIPILIIGIVGLWYSKRLQRNAGQMAKTGLDNIGAVMGEIKKRSD